MRKVDVNSIHVGSCFSNHVYFEDGINMFLPKNRYATENHVDLIKKWNVPYLLTFGKELERPEELEDFVEIEDVTDLENYK